ncbi:hypothetical protein [Streptomyces antimycoticus]|uniref:hypothetical protein n=1 Tax=Streptomyces antimycoticus TaxID=68175 RepID=UPI000A390A59|nr:hypothetical protein [Streptomyces antimycoticus]
MQKRTLARSALAGAGWAHPYTTGPFDPYLYADGGDGGDSGSDDSGSSDDGSDDTGNDDTGGTGDDGTGDDDAAKDDKPKPKPPAKKDGEDPAAELSRLRKELKEARQEAGKARTTAKETAAQEATQKVTQEIGKLLGFVKDDTEEAPDPAKLRAEIEKATTAHRETAVELAVYRGAAKHGADPDALTDSRAFLRSIRDLDPTSDGFAKKVDAAIKAAVEDNPKLKAASQAPARSSSDFSGSSEKSTKPTGIDAQREARRKSRAG